MELDAKTSIVEAKADVDETKGTKRASAIERITGAGILGGTDEPKPQDNKKNNAPTPLPKMFLSECHKFHTNPKFVKKADVSVSTTNTNNGGTKSDADASDASIDNSNSSNVLNKALKRKQRLAQYKGQIVSSGPTQSSLSMNFNLGPGLPCHAVWAPNSNYCKNAELLAIASPLNMSIAGNSLGGGSSNASVINNQSANNLNPKSTGSNVYVLVFDEGTFAHGGEFNLSDELCELFGLPTEKMPNDKRSNETRCGMRRPVFHNSHLKNDSKVDSPDDGDNVGRVNDTSTEGETATLSKTVQIAQKAQSLYSDLTTKCIQPFVAHIVNETNNCHRVFTNEVFGDGRIFNKSTNSRKNKEETQSSGCESPNKADKKVAPNVKPQLVFHVNLPYSNTSMEITGLDWNSDGTSLSIIQRRKGSPNAFSTVSSTFTNKKKKASLNTVSPGNTAVSFWSIPEWLHVTCDELKLCDENDDLRHESDGMIFKANKVEDSVGWEVGVTDENRSLFPLWEWYLAKYIFHDEPNSIDSSISGPRSKIMMKNCMEYVAYPMELSTNPASTSIRGGKKALRSGRAVSCNTDTTNALMNGDVTCIVWEDSPAENTAAVEEKMKNDANPAEKDSDDTELGTHEDEHDKGDNLIPASKWIAIGTSKGQMILHNGAASYLSYQQKKASRKGTTDKSKNTLSSGLNASSQGRTVVVPLRHKKRITCGAWADNLLVFGHVSTGSLTLVCTFSKTAVVEGNDTTTKSLDLLGDKSVKVLGSILLPGGRDAIKIQIGNIEENLTILSVNCEGKCLLFYNFPKLLNNTNTSTQASDITSSPAIELNFSMLNNSNVDDGNNNPSQAKGNSHCGNIIFHYLIPDTLLVLVAFSSGYFALVDWVSGVILSDEDIAKKSHMQTNGVSSIHESDITNDFTKESHQDNFLLDVTYHVPTSTVACVTQDGNVLVYYVRILDGYNEVTAGDCVCKTGITINTKTHTRPKTKTSSYLVDCDSSIKRILGTIEFMCAHSIPQMPAIQSDARKGDLINFSSDGECISLSLGDESVLLLSIKVENDEADQLKHKMAQSIYLGKDSILKFFTFALCATIVWQFGKMEGAQDYAFVEYL